MKNTNSLPTLALFALVSGSTLLQSCKDSVTGPSTVAERTAAGFSRIEVNNGFDVELIIGETEGISLEAPESAMSHIMTTVSGNRLHVYIDDKVSTDFSPKRVVIRARNIEDIELSGGTNLIARGTLDEQTVAIGASGGSTADVTLATPHLDLEASGGSQLTVRGLADVINASSFSGGSKLDAYPLQARNVTVDASGGSIVRVRASERLDVDASGGSSIRYKGNPSVTSDLSGGSEIIDEN